MYQDIAMNQKKFVPKLKEEFGEHPISSIADGLTIIGTFATFAAFIRGITDGSASGHQSLLSKLQEVPLAGKILLFIIIAAAIGWSMSAITIWLTKRRGEMELVFGHVLAACWAALLAGFAEWMFAGGAVGTIPFSSLMLLCGIFITFKLAITKYRLVHTSELEMIHARSGFLMTFALSILFLALVSMFVR